MAIPTVVGVSASATSSANNITPAYPTGYTAVGNDVAITYVETNSETFTPPTNWATVASVPVSSGTTTRLTAIWRRLTASEAAPTITEPGGTWNHAVGRMIVVNGCATTGNPWDIVVTDTELTSDTSVSVTGGTTTVANCLILAAFAMGNDIANTTALTWTNANLGSVTHQMANWVATGTGGGFAVCTGTKASAGATGNTTTTSSVSANFKALMMIALREPPATAPPAKPRGYQGYPYVVVQ